MKSHPAGAPTSADLSGSIGVVNPRTIATLFRIVAVVIGFTGIAIISIASVDQGTSADVKGIALLAVALLCYAVAANIAQPMYPKYGSLAPMLWMTVIASVLSLPYGLVGLARGGIDLPALGALFMLGAVGTGIAFALYGVLLSRAGTVRGMIGIFFTPIVGTILGVAVRGDKLHAAAILGMLIVLVGAVMVSRPEPRHLDSGVEEPLDLVLPESLLEVGDQVGSALDAD